MTTFKDQLAADAAVFFNPDEFADAAVYNDGTADHDIVVILDETGDAGTGRKGAGAQALVPAAQMPDPQYRQTITINGRMWRIDQKPGRGGYPCQGGVWQLPVISDQQVSPWRT